MVNGKGEQPSEVSGHGACETRCPLRIPVFSSLLFHASDAAPKHAPLQKTGRPHVPPDILQLYASRTYCMQIALHSVLLQFCTRVFRTDVKERLRHQRNHMKPRQLKHINTLSIQPGLETTYPQADGTCQPRPCSVCIVSQVHCMHHPA